MPQEPWKRARQLQDLKQSGVTPVTGKGKQISTLRRRSRWPQVVFVVLLLLVIGGGVALYFSRGWWLPRYRDQLPPQLRAAVEQAAPEPEVTLDYQAIESGLGIELRIFGDYLDVLNATNDWGMEWKLTDTGNNTQRCAAPGLMLSIEQGRIRSFELDLETVFAEKAWQPWINSLKRAGLSPDLTWTALTGEDEMPGGVAEREIHSSNDAQWVGTDAHAMWKLKFHDGWLRYIIGGIAISEVSLEDAERNAQPDVPPANTETTEVPSDPELEFDWVE